MNELYDDAISTETAGEWLSTLAEKGRDITAADYRFQAWSVLRHCERKKRRLRKCDPKALTFADHGCLQAYAAIRNSLVPVVGWGWLEGLD